MTLTLLVVDDQLSLRRLFEVVAGEDSRYATVHCASRGADAVRLAAQHAPDAVLLDVGLGQEDGLSLVAPLRDAAPDTVVVIYSSQPHADHETARRAGADLFVPKGTDPDLILDLIAQQVEGRRAPTRAIDLTGEAVH